MHNDSVIACWPARGCPWYLVWASMRNNVGFVPHLTFISVLFGKCSSTHEYEVSNGSCYATGYSWIVKENTQYTDSLVTYRKWHEDMWEDICGLRMMFGVKEVTIDLRKVKSHVTVEEMEQVLSSPILKHGNGRADCWAGKGAEVYQVPELTMKVVNQVDVQTWIIQKRLVKILQTSMQHYKKQEIFLMEAKKNVERRKTNLKKVQGKISSL